MSTAELKRPLPDGVFHLLAADDDVASAHPRGYVAVCGLVMVALGLPSCYPDVGPGLSPIGCWLSDAPESAPGGRSAPDPAPPMIPAGYRANRLPVPGGQPVPPSARWANMPISAGTLAADE